MNLKQLNDTRSQLLTMFSIALSAVDGKNCTEVFLSQNRIPTMNVRVVAIGKAAAGMMDGAVSALGQSLLSGLVITKQGHVVERNDPRIVYLESDHPIPSERSLFAGEQLVEFVKQVKVDELLLVLISGGASALVEMLDNSVTVEQLAKLNDWFISNPYSIAKINAARKSISKIKAGRLLNYINTEHIIQLTISDVQGNDLSVIGSGLLVADESSDTKDTTVSNETALPGWLATLIKSERAVSESIVKTTLKIKQYIVADNQLAREAILSYAGQQGLSVHLNQEIYLELTIAAEKISKTLNNGEPGVYVWGGECVLSLPKHPGLGGRCQSLALAIAQQIIGTNIFVLAAGTDGTDGPGETAGALVDGQTIRRGEELGLNASQELQKANAGYYLAETGDLIDTGPTNTNVMDLIIAFKYSDQAH